MKTSIEISQFTNFLQSGVILQVATDQFKLIWGNFKNLVLESTAHLGQKTDQKTIIYRPDFWDFTSGKSGLCLIGSEEVTLSRSELLQLLSQFVANSVIVEWQTATTADFTEQFQWSMEKFAAHKFIKSVPLIAQAGAISFTQFHLVHALKTLIEGEHFGYTYGYWQSGAGCLGQTPELIANWSESNQTLQTVALAGTQPVAVSDQQVLSDLKLLREHEIVVQDMSEVIQAVCKHDQIEISPLEILKLKYLKHLMTTFKITNLNKNDAIRLMKQLHPSAALGLYPRMPSLYQSFKNFPLQKRRAGFAAPIGLITGSNMLVVAAIRSFYFTPVSIEIFSGCGVTEQSVLSNELTEVENKRNSVKKMMGMNL